MIVNVSEIKDGGLSLNLTRGPGWLGGSEKSEIASVVSDIEFHIDLVREADKVSVRGENRILGGFPMFPLLKRRKR